MPIQYEVVRIDPLVRNLPSVENKVKSCGLPPKCSAHLTHDRSYVVIVSAQQSQVRVLQAKMKVEDCLAKVVASQSRGPFGHFDLEHISRLLEPGKFSTQGTGLSAKNFFKQLITKYNLIAEGTNNADIQFTEKYRQKKTLSSLTAVCRNCSGGGFRCALTFGKAGVSISAGQIQAVSSYTNYLKKNKGLYKVTELSARWAKMTQDEKDMYQTDEKTNTQHCLVHNCQYKVVVPKKRRRAHSGIVNMAKEALKYSVAETDDETRQNLKTGVLHTMLEKDRGLRISKSTVTSLRENLLKSQIQQQQQQQDHDVDQQQQQVLIQHQDKRVKLIQGVDV